MSRPSEPRAADRGPALPPAALLRDGLEAALARGLAPGDRVLVREAGHPAGAHDDFELHVRVFQVRAQICGEVFSRFSEVLEWVSRFPDDLAREET